MEKEEGGAIKEPGKHESVCIRVTVSKLNFRPVLGINPTRAHIGWTVFAIAVIKRKMMGDGNIN